MNKKQHSIPFAVTAAVLALVCFALPFGGAAFSLRAEPDTAVSQTFPAQTAAEKPPTVTEEKQADIAETPPAAAAQQTAHIAVSEQADLYKAEPDASASGTELPSGAETPAKPQRPEPVTKETDMVSGETYTDALRTAQDIHRYHFTVPERGMVYYTLTFPSRLNLSGCEARLYRIYYKNGVGGETGLRLLNTLYTYAADGGGTSSKIGVLPGEYCITVSSGDVTELGDYTLQMQFSARTDYEIEFNDTPTRYTELSSGVQLRGSACYREDGTDTDWYLFRMYRSGAIALKFRHTTGKLLTTAFKVTLYNERFEEIYTGLSPFNLGTLNSGTLGAEPGIYYVCVENRVFYEGDYGLTLTAVTGSDYETEPNDTAEDACFLASDTPVTGALTAKDGLADKDWYCGTLDEPGFVQLTLSAAGGGEGEKQILRLTLRTAAGETVYAGLLNDAETETVTPEIGLSAGDFYVQIDNEDLYLYKGDYTLAYTFSPAAYAETEPNDALSRANVLPQKTVLTGTVTDGAHGYDTDYYRITPESPMRFVLRFTHSEQVQTGTVYTLELLRSDGAAVAAADGRKYFDVPADQAETAVPYSLPAGTYYVKISAGLFADSGRYTISYTAE